MAYGLPLHNVAYGLALHSRSETAASDGATHVEILASSLYPYERNDRPP
jgi:hypothetical protein